MRRRGSRLRQKELTLTYDNIFLDISSSFGITGSISDLGVSRNFSKMYVLTGFGASSVYQLELNNPSDISANTYNNLNIVVALDSRGFYINNANDKIYVSSGDISQYNLGNSNDVSTAVNASKNFGINGGEGFCFSADEKRLFKNGSYGSSTNRIIYRYNLTVAGDGTTLSGIIDQYDMVSESGGLGGIALIENGSKILAGNPVHLYKLTDPYSLNGILLIKNLVVGSFVGIAVNESFKKIYLATKTGIYQYSYN